MNVDISTLIALGGIALSAATFFIGRISAGRSSGKQEGIIQADIGYIKTGIDDLRRQLEKYDDKFEKLSDRISRVESKADSAHKRLDDHGVGRAN